MCCSFGLWIWLLACAHQRVRYDARDAGAKTALMGDELRAGVITAIGAISANKLALNVRSRLLARSRAWEITDKVCSKRTKHLQSVREIMRMTIST